MAPDPTLAPHDNDVPVFVLKASDALIYPVVVQYTRMCREFGQENQAQQAALAAEEIRVWQEANPHRTHLPDHPHVPHEERQRSYTTFTEGEPE